MADISIENIEKSEKAMESFSDATSFANETLEKMHSLLKSAGVNFTSLSSSGSEAATVMGLLNTKILTVSDSFSKIGNHDISSSYMQQFADIKESMGTAFNEAAVTSLGVAIPATVKGFSALNDYVSKFFKTMDQRSKLGDFFIQASAATGQLGAAFSAGENPLAQFNQKLSEQDQLMLSVIKSTGLTRDQITSLYSKIALIPGAMNNFTASVRNSTDQTTILQASIELAKGTGTEYSTVIADMTKAYEDLNLTGNSALDMTTRISEASTKLGLRMSDVRSFIHTSADALGYFGANATNSSSAIDGSTRLLMNYSNALKEVGLSSKQVQEVNRGFVDSINQLSISQKSYISSQSGGPGGLLGAFNIDKMLKRGETDKVFEMMKSTIQKKTGNFMSIDDVKSEQSASVYNKQIQMLMQGPLGKIVHTQAQAEKVLEAFAKGEKVTKITLEDNIKAEKSKQRKQGTALLDTQRTIMSVARATITANQISMEGTNYALGTRMMAAQTVDQDKGTAKEDNTFRTWLRDQATHGGKINETELKDKTASLNEIARAAFHNSKEVFSAIPSALGQMKSGFKYATGKNEIDISKSTSEDIQKKIDAKRLELQRDKSSDHKLEFAKLNELEKRNQSKMRDEAIKASKAAKEQEDELTVDGKVKHTHMQDGKSQHVTLDINAYCAACHKQIHVPSNPQGRTQVGTQAGK